MTPQVAARLHTLACAAGLFHAHTREVPGHVGLAAPVGLGGVMWPQCIFTCDG
jgi:hypothetical protein